jgi:hypothetical protein
MERKTLNSASEVIDELGGTGEAARQCSKSEQAISNWRTRGIPPEMFILINERLAAKNAVAAASAFSGMIDPASTEAA